MFFKKKVNGYRTLSGDTQDWTLQDGEKSTLLRVGKTWYASEYNYDTLSKMLLGETLLDLDELGFEQIEPQWATGAQYGVAQTLEQAGSQLTKVLNSISGMLTGNQVRNNGTEFGEAPVVDGGVEGLGSYTKPSTNPFTPQLGGDEIS